MSRSGTLTGIEGVNQGLGLDVQVYGKFVYRREWEDELIGREETNSLKFVMSGNAYYKITPGLTGTLTVNPDFSNSPLDIRQVNTTRFVLFQPETRDFFLQDAAAFEFGGRGFLRSDNIGRDNGRPFFSRNIGLANGRPVSIIDRRQGVGPVRQYRHRRADGADRRHRHGHRAAGAIGRAHHRAGVRGIESRPHLHQRRSDGREQELARRRRLPVSQFQLPAGQGRTGGFLLSAQLFGHRKATTTSTASA